MDKDLLSVTGDKDSIDGILIEGVFLVQRFGLMAWIFEFVSLV